MPEADPSTEYRDAMGRPPVGVYGAGCDVSQGVGASNSTFTVVSATGEKVLEYVTPTTLVADFAKAVLAMSANCAAVRPPTKASSR